MRWLILLLAPLMLAATPYAGPPIAVSALQPGDPASMDFLAGAWLETDGVTAVMTRGWSEHASVVRMTIRRDGTADPAVLVPLPFPPAVFNLVATPTLVAWRTTSGAFAQRIDGGQPFPVALDRYLAGLACNATRCLLFDGSRAAILDSNGRTLRMIDEPIDAAAASPSGFITRGALVAIRDDDGVVKATIGVHAGAAVAYDNARYVVADPDDRVVRVTAYDTVAGLASPTHALTVADSTSAVDRCALAWNGSQLLLLSRIGYLPPMQPADLPPPVYASIRLTGALQPLDAAPRTLFDAPFIEPVVVVGTEDGFRILFTKGYESPRIRTIFVRGSDGVAESNAQPIVTDRASQFPITATSSRTSILGVWTDGDGRTLFAARPFDAKPIVIDENGPFDAVYAASDGDGFLVIWRNGPVRAALIDVAGSVTPVTLDPALAIAPAHLEFVDGAYRFAAFGWNEVIATTITPAGVVSALETMPVDGILAQSVSVRFDGRRIIAVWSIDNSLYSAVKTIGGGVTKHLLLQPLPKTRFMTDILPDGDTYVIALRVFDDDSFRDGARLFLNRLAADGSLVVRDYGSLVERVPWSTSWSLIRIDGAWFIADGAARTLIPFSNVSFKTEAAVPMGEALDTLVPGSNGEALLVDAHDVPITSGFATQMFVRVLHAAPHHGHAVR